MTRAPDAPRFTLDGVEFAGGAAPSRGSAGLCTWTITVEPGHDSLQGHLLDSDEVFTVLSGTITLAPEAAGLHAGDTAVVRAGTLIQLANPGDAPARVHVVIAAGFSASMADGTVIGTPPWAQ